MDCRPYLGWTSSFLLEDNKEEKEMNKEKVYALYKGDDLLEIGTKKELAEKFGVKAKTIAFYNTPAYQKRTSSEKGRRLVMLD